MLTLQLANDELDTIHDMVVNELLKTKELIKFNKAREKYHRKDEARLTKIYDNIMKLYDV